MTFPVDRAKAIKRSLKQMQQFMRPVAVSVAKAKPIKLKVKLAKPKVKLAPKARLVTLNKVVLRRKVRQTLLAVTARNTNLVKKHSRLKDDVNSHGRYWRRRRADVLAKAYAQTTIVTKQRRPKKLKVKSLRFARKRLLTLKRKNRKLLKVEKLLALKKRARIKQRRLRVYLKKRKALNVLANSTQWNKTKVSTYDKLFYYYTVKTPMSAYAHKAFVLLEMQLNASLVRMKLVPNLSLVEDMCFYRIVRLNNATTTSPFHVLSLYDSVSIPVALYNYMYYRQYRVQHYPRKLAKFLKRYWMQFTNYNQNKVWLLTNFLVSNITAEAMVFDYPNIISYMSPFRRFTNVYYKNQQYTEVGGEGNSLTYTHTIIKLKLFTYASFYKPN